MLTRFWLEKCDSRLTQVSDPTGTYQFTFDNMGRLTGTSTQYAFLTSRTFTTSYGGACPERSRGNAASNRTSFTDPENGTSSYVYDTLNRLQTLTPPAAISSGNFGFGYDALSRRTSLTRPNTVNTSYGCDTLSRLLSVTHAKGGVTLDGATYTVDNAGNRTAKSDLYAGVNTNYGYDNIYEPLSATQGGSTTESYTYDPVGNRLTALGSATWSYNTSNELNSRPGASYAYDGWWPGRKILNDFGCPIRRFCVWVLGLRLSRSHLRPVEPATTRSASRLAPICSDAANNSCRSRRMREAGRALGSHSIATTLRTA